MTAYSSTSINGLLYNKMALITGATGGLGKALAKRFFEAGANLILLGRDERSLRNIASELSQGQQEGPFVHCVVLDFSDINNIPVTAAEILRNTGAPDILINNAGIQGPIGEFTDNDWGAWEETIRVNFLSAVIMCRVFVPEMLKREGGRIINISGGGATGPRPNFTAYACSKTALVRFSETIAEELKEKGISVNCIAPGALKTKMTAQILEAGADRSGIKEHSTAERLSVVEGGEALHKAADLCVFLASKTGDGITGKLISAVWDPWEALHTRINELSNTDIYTLRRIVPKDRGFDW